MKTLKIIDYVRYGHRYHHIPRIFEAIDYSDHSFPDLYPDHIFVASVLSTLVTLLLFGLLWYFIFRHASQPAPTVELIEYILPNWTAPYLIKGDFSGYTDDEIKKMDEFLAREDVRFVQINDENFFSHYNRLDNVGAICSVFLAIKN